MNMVQIAMSRAPMTGNHRALYQEYCRILWALAQETIADESPMPGDLVPGAVTGGQVLRHLAELSDKMLQECLHGRDAYEVPEGDFVPVDQLFPHLRGVQVADEIQHARTQLVSRESYLKTRQPTKRVNRRRA